MKLVSGLSATAMALLTGCSSMPGGMHAGHAAHHQSYAAASTPGPAGYDQQMKTMQQMHQMMAAAKTPQERSALMKDHMKTMQDGMAMMGRMREPMGGATGAAGSTPMDPEMMQRRIDMMDMMMQMMMDRQGLTVPSTR